MKGPCNFPLELNVAGPQNPKPSLVLLSSGFRFRVWGLGFGVWGLGFGVWGLGFGV